jgi:hypothetical protein
MQQGLLKFPLFAFGEFRFDTPQLAAGSFISDFK